MHQVFVTFTFCKCYVLTYDTSYELKGLGARRTRPSRGVNQPKDLTTSVAQNDRGNPSRCSATYEKIRFVEIGAT